MSAPCRGPKGDWGGLGQPFFQTGFAKALAQRGDSHRHLAAGLAADQAAQILRLLLIVPGETGQQIGGVGHALLAMVRDGDVEDTGGFLGLGIADQQLGPIVMVAGPGDRDGVAGEHAKAVATRGGGRAA